MYEGSAIRKQTPQPRPASKPSDEREVVTGTIHPCCEQAVRKPCVCRVSWQCPVHGGWCVGSHD